MAALRSSQALSCATTIEMNHRSETNAPRANQGGGVKNEQTHSSGGMLSACAPVGTHGAHTMWSENEMSGWTCCCQRAWWCRTRPSHGDSLLFRTKKQWSLRSQRTCTRQPQVRHTWAWRRPAHRRPPRSVIGRRASRACGRSPSRAMAPLRTTPAPIFGTRSRGDTHGHDIDD